MLKETDMDDFEIGSGLTRTDGNQFQGNLEIGPTIQQKFVSACGLNDKHSPILILGVLTKANHSV